MSAAQNEKEVQVGDCILIFLRLTDGARQAHISVHHRPYILDFFGTKLLVLFRLRGGADGRQQWDECRSHRTVTLRIGQMPGVESGRLSWAAPLRNVAGCEAHWPQSPEGAFAIFDSATPAVLHGLVTGEPGTWLPAGLLSGHEMVRVVTNPTPVAPLKRRGDTLVRPAELQLSWAEAVKTLVDGTRRHYAYASAVSLDHSPKVRDALPLRRALHLAGDALQRSNLWLNPPHKGMRSALHYDGHDNLLVQLRGEKEVLLFPPELHALLRYRPRSEHVYSNATGSEVAGRPSLSFETHSPRSGRGGATLENHAALAVFADEEVLHLEGEAGAPSDEEWARLVPHARICTLRPGQTLFLPALS